MNSITRKLPPSGRAPRSYSWQMFGWLRAATARASWGECALRSLDRDEAVEAGVAGLVDFAHAAGSYGREDFVGSEVGA